MHESLTETLHLAVTVISVCHHCKVRVHTGIPAAVTLYAVSCVIIFDIIALAGRAYKCTGTTCQTRFVQFFPYRGVELFCQCISVPSFQRQIRIWQFFYDRTNSSFFCLQFFCICAVSFCQEAFYCFGQCLTFVSQGFPVQFFSCKPGCHICSRFCTVNTKYLAKTAFLRLMTGNRHHGSMLSSCCIKAVHRIC